MAWYWYLLIVVGALAVLPLLLSVGGWLFSLFVTGLAIVGAALLAVVGFPFYLLDKFLNRKKKVQEYRPPYQINVKAGMTPEEAARLRVAAAREANRQSHRRSR